MTPDEIQAARDPYMLRAIVSRWLRIRAEHIEKSQGFIHYKYTAQEQKEILTQIAADADHSWLLERLFRGEEPLPFEEWKGGAAPIVSSWHRQTSADDEKKALVAEIERLTRERDEVVRNKDEAVAECKAQNAENWTRHRELLKLRDEVERLRGAFRWFYVCVGTPEWFGPSEHQRLQEALASAGGDTAERLCNHECVGRCSCDRESGENPEITEAQKIAADPEPRCTCTPADYPLRDVGMHTCWTNSAGVSNEGHAVNCPANPMFRREAKP